MNDEKFNQNNREKLTNIIGINNTTATNSINNNTERATFNTNLMTRWVDPQFKCSKCGGTMYRNRYPLPNHPSVYKCAICGYESDGPCV